MTGDTVLDRLLDHRCSIWYIWQRNGSSAWVVEKMIIDRFLQSLPTDLRKFVGQGNPDTLKDFVVEKQIAAEHLSQPHPYMSKWDNWPPPSPRSRNRGSTGKT